MLTAVLLTETAAAAPAPAGRLASASMTPMALRSPSDPRELQRALDDLRGHVIASPVLLSPHVEADRPGLITLQRFQASSFVRSGGFWRLHLIAFLTQPAPAASLTLSIEDVSVPGAPLTMRSIDVPVQPGSRVVRLNDFVISDDLGFAPGHSYQLTFSHRAPARRPGGAMAAGRVPADRKEDAIARGVITLW